MFPLNVTCNPIPGRNDELLPVSEDTLLVEKDVFGYRSVLGIILSVVLAHRFDGLIGTALLSRLLTEGYAMPSNPRFVLT